jgi:peptidyl-prolyl cis-trans isomerase D
MRASQGVSLQTLATEFGGIFKNPGVLGRNGISLVEPAVLSAAFSLPHPIFGKVAFGSTVLANGDHVLLEVARVLQGQKDSISDWERRSLIEQLVKRTGSSQFRGLLEGLRTRINVVTYNDRIQ